MQPKKPRHNVLAVLLCLALVGVAAAEYYRYDMNSRAEARERTARQLQQEVADLRRREQQLAPDRPLLERIDQTLLDPRSGNLHRQIAEQVLANQERAGAEFRNVVMGPQGFLQAANRHSLSTQLQGPLGATVAFLQSLETGPAAARVVAVNIGAEQGGSRQATINIDYYSRAK